MSEQWSSVVGAGGQRFVYAEAGEGPPVVLIHGFPDTPHGWERISEELVEAGFRTIRPWLRGYHPDTFLAGRRYDLRAIGADPIALLDALGEPDAILVGHDWGAAMVYGAASQAPDRVKAIVPIAIPHPSHLPRNLPTLWAARHFLALNMPWAERAVRANDFAYLERLYRRWSPRWAGPERDRALADAKATFADGRLLSGALDYYRALSPRIPPELAKPPAVRALLVAGTTDLDPRVYERTAAALGPGSEAMIVDGAGHWPHREDEDRFIARLIEFAGAR